MKKKGFTLVELLTVIAILAIILLVASPIILNVLEKAKQSSFKNQVLLYVEGVKQKAVLSQVGEGNIVLPGVGESVDVDITTIVLDIDKNYTGVVRITNNNGKYEYEVVNIIGDGYTANGPTNTIKVTKAGNKPDIPPAPTYTAYNIGDQVTLKDNSVWYVIENSDSSSDTVTLFASQNIKKDASGWSTIHEESVIAFDETNARLTENNSYCTNPNAGCNIYAAQNGIVTNGDISGTVSEDSTIKKFIDNSVLAYINNSLTANGGTNINSIRLITNQEICNIINIIDSSNNCVPPTVNINLTSQYVNVPTWLYSTSYWTMTVAINNSWYLYRMDGVANISALHLNAASNDQAFGARPVIVTNKSNIK